MVLSNTEVLGWCGTDSEILGERPGPLALCPPKLLNILPLEDKSCFRHEKLDIDNLKYD